MFVACQIVNDYLKACLLNHELMDCCMTAGVLFWSQNTYSDGRANLNKYFADFW